MAATGTPTPNIGLRRPQGTDPASVDDINYNSNLIDTKLGAVGNTSVQEQINSLNSKFATTVKITSVGRYSGDGIAAGETSLYTITFSGSDIPTGYKPIGLVSFTNNTGVFFAEPTDISGTAMTVRLYNASGTATAPGNMTFGIMHVLA